MVEVGYKQTEVGVIPEDWEDPVSFDVLFKISGGLSASRDQLSDGGICYLHYGDIHAKSLTYINVEDEYYDLPKLDISMSKVSAKSVLNDGDMVFVDASEDDDGVSKFIVIDNPTNIDFISGLHTIVVKSKDKRLDNNFKHYIFENKSLKNQLIGYACGTKVKGINKTNIKKVLLAFPPLPEQQKIAKALTDTDNLIQSIEKLIVKKKDIKKGAMQNLLTGKKRLDGFSGKWVERKIEQLAKTSSGGTPSRRIVEYYNGNIKWFTTSELNDSYLGDSNEHISDVALEKSSTKLFPLNTVLIAMYGATIGKLGILKNLASTNQACCAIICKEDRANYVFVYYSLMSIRDDIIALGSGAGQPNISQDIVKSLILYLPPTVEEQTAIATILSDMDKELEELENKLNKYKQIKQGMMQKLLTGKIRLI